MRKVLLILLLALLGVSTGLIFGVYGVLVLLALSITVLMVLEWHYRQREKELEDILRRLDQLIEEQEKIRSRIS